MKVKGHQKRVKDLDELTDGLIQYLKIHCQTISKPSDASLFIVQYRKQ